MTGFDAIAAQGLGWKDAKTIPPSAKMLLIYGSPDKPDQSEEAFKNSV